MSLIAGETYSVLVGVANRSRVGNDYIPVDFTVEMVATGAGQADVMKTTGLTVGANAYAEALLPLPIEPDAFGTGTVTVQLKAPGDILVDQDSVEFTVELPTGELSGRIYDMVNNTNLHGAKFEINGQIAYADSEGNYSFPSIPVGTYPATVSMDGYEPTHFPGLVISPGQNFINVGLLLAFTETANISGQGTIAGAPAPDVQVVLSGYRATGPDTSEQVRYETLTDVNGQYSFNNIWTLNYSISFTLEGFVPQIKSADVTFEDVTVNVSLLPLEGDYFSFKLGQVRQPATVWDATLYDVSQGRWEAGIPSGIKELHVPVAVLPKLRDVMLLNILTQNFGDPAYVWGPFLVENIPPGQKEFIVNLRPLGQGASLDGVGAIELPFVDNESAITGTVKGYSWTENGWAANFHINSSKTIDRLIRESFTYQNIRMVHGTCYDGNKYIWGSARYATPGYGLLIKIDKDDPANYQVYAAPGYSAGEYCIWHDGKVYILCQNGIRTVILEFDPETGIFTQRWIFSTPGTPGGLVFAFGYFWAAIRGMILVKIDPVTWQNLGTVELYSTPERTATIAHWIGANSTHLWITSSSGQNYNTMRVNPNDLSDIRVVVQGYAITDDAFVDDDYLYAAIEQDPSGILKINCITMEKEAVIFPGSKSSYGVFGFTPELLVACFTDNHLRVIRKSDLAVIWEIETEAYAPNEIWVIDNRFYVTMWTSDPLIVQVFEGTEEMESPGAMDIARYFRGTDIFIQQFGVPVDTVNNPLVPLDAEVVCKLKMGWKTYNSSWQAYEFHYPRPYPESYYQGYRMSVTVGPPTDVTLNDPEFGPYIETVRYISWQVWCEQPIPFSYVVTRRYGSNIYAVSKGSLVAGNGATGSFWVTDNDYNNNFAGIGPIYCNPDPTAKDRWDPLTWQQDNWVRAVAT